MGLCGERLGKLSLLRQAESEGPVTSQGIWVRHPLLTSREPWKCHCTTQFLSDTPTEESPE